MTFRNTERLREWLHQTGHHALADAQHFTVEAEDFKRHLTELVSRHAHRDDSYHRDRAIFRCVTSVVPPVEPQAKEQASAGSDLLASLQDLNAAIHHAERRARVQRWLILALAVLLVLLVAVKGHAQTITIPCKATASDPTLTEGTRAPCSVDLSGHMRTLASGATGGTSATDNSTFTGGTTSVTPIGAWYSTSPTAISDGKTGIPRMDSNRYLYTNCIVGCSAAGDTSGNSQVVGALNDATSVAMAGENGAVVNITSRSSPVLTIVAEVSPDGGTTWTSAVFLDSVSGAMVTSIANPANGQYQLAWVGAETNARVRTSAYTSGAITMQTRATVTRPWAFMFGSDGTNIRALKTGTDGTLKVDGSAVTQPVSGTFWQATQPVSGTFWQATQPVSGTFWQATQPVSAASLPLPSGASTSAKQPALGTAGTASADVITVQGITSMTPLKTDGSGVTQPVSGTFWQATQPVSGTFWQATQPVSLSGNQAVNVAQVGGTNIVSDPCESNAKVYTPINVTTNTQLITGTSAKKTYFCALNIGPVNAANNVAIVQGTGSVCATGISGIFGGTTAATGWNIAANGGLTLGVGRYSIGAGTVNADNTCIFVSAASQVSGVLVTVVQ